MASSCPMPQPLSLMAINFLPPASTSTRMRVAAASMEFSRSSLTTEAGRSTTSPAAILLATLSESTRIRPIGVRLTRSRQELVCHSERLIPVREEPSPNECAQRRSFHAFGMANEHLSFHRDPEFLQLRRAYWRRRIHHHVHSLGRLGEWNDFSQAVSSSKNHHDAVESQRYTAVRRRAVLQRFEEESEPGARFFVRHTQRVEDLLLNVLTVNTN